MAMTMEQLINHHSSECKLAAEKVEEKPQSNVEQMIWNAYFARLQFHSQALELLLSLPSQASLERSMHSDLCVCPGCEREKSLRNGR